MKSFKVGDRVRIVCPASPRNGKTGTVWKISVWKPSDYSVVMKHAIAGECAFMVDIDGLGRGDDEADFAYCKVDLRPIVNPDETAWTEFKRHLQPGPAIILAKEAA